MKRLRLAAAAAAVCALGLTGSLAAATAASAATVWTDTGFVIVGLANTCTNTVPGALGWSASPAGEITTAAPATDGTLSVGSASTLAGLSSVTNTNGSLTVKGTAGDAATSKTVVVVENYGTGCDVAQVITPVTETAAGDLVPAAASGTATLDTVTALAYSYVVGGVQFTGAPVPGGFAFATPAGVVVSGGELVIAGSTAAKAFYGSQGVTYTDALGAARTDSFGLTVSATAEHQRNPHVFGPGTVVNFNGKCLDARDLFGHQAATVLQEWTCGADGGTDQLFVYSTADHTLRYADSAGLTGFCVTQAGPNVQATLTACGSPVPVSQQVTWDKGGFYRFAGNGAVLDNAAGRNVNGNKVLIWTYHDANNQRFTLPG